MWFRDLKSGRELRLTGPGAGSGPVISPDGKTVVFVMQEQSSPDRSRSLFVMTVDGGQAEKLIEGIDLSSNGWLFTRNGVLFQAGESVDWASPQVFLLDINTKKPQIVLEHDEYKFSGIFPSPDDRWISFVATTQGRPRVFIAQLHSGRAAPESEWVALTDGGTFEDQPRWSPDGKLLYFISARDRSRCTWAKRLDPVSKRPLGEAFAVHHFHDGQRNLVGITLGHDRIVFARSEATGSIWLAEPQ